MSVQEISTIEADVRTEEAKTGDLPLADACEKIFQVLGNTPLTLADLDCQLKRRGLDYSKASLECVLRENPEKFNNEKSRKRNVYRLKDFERKTSDGGTALRHAEEPRPAIALECHVNPSDRRAFVFVLENTGDRVAVNVKVLPIEVPIPERIRVQHRELQGQTGLPVSDPATWIVEFDVVQSSG